MATDAEHHGLAVEGYIETVKFTSRNSRVLSLYEELVASDGAARVKQIEALVVVVNGQDIRGQDVRDSFNAASADASEHALDAVRHREAELDDVDIPGAYQSDEEEQRAAKKRKNKSKRRT